MTSYPLTVTPGDEPPSARELQQRLDDAFTLWRTSRYPRAEVGTLLPTLLEPDVAR